MKMNSDKNIKHSEKQMPQLNGKKIMCGVLVIILVMMWARVFLKSSDPVEEVNAETSTGYAGKPKGKSVKYKRISLPFEFGRHDRLTTDMFTSKALREIAGSETEVKNEQLKLNLEKNTADRIAKNLVLEAIILGVGNRSDRAFINGKLLISGDNLTVKLDNEQYDLNVAGIFHNKAVLKWNEYTISVRMAKLNR